MKQKTQGNKKGVDKMARQPIHYNIKEKTQIILKQQEIIIYCLAKCIPLDKQEKRAVKDIIRELEYLDTNKDNVRTY